MKLRVVFMGTPEFAVPALEAVQSAHEIVAVYTQPDRPEGRGLNLRASPVKVAAQKFGIPILQPEKLSQPGEFEKLESLKPDVIVIVAYGQILRQRFLEFPRLGCINIHSSLLPRWRGAAPIHWSILKGDSETGVTTMRIVEKLDAGAILMQKATPVRDDDTIQSLHDRLAQMGAELILPTLQGIESGSLLPREQDETQVTYAAKLTKEMEWLNPEESAVDLDRKVRALNPWPGTSIKVGQRLKIKTAKVRTDIQGPQGQIFQRAGMLLLGTSCGSLELLSVQWDGKKPVDAASFLSGLKGSGRSLPLTLD